MWPQNIENDISEIRNLFDNYIYIKKTKTELEDLKIKIIKTKENLKFYQNKEIINLSEKYKQNTNEKGCILPSLIFKKTSDFYHNCSSLIDLFSIFLNNVKKRIETFENGFTEFSEEEKGEFYDEIWFYIEKGNVERIEKLLLENLIDVNYAPLFLDEDNEDDEDDVEDWRILIHLMTKACQFNNLAIVKLLYYSNANINIISMLDNANNIKTTPLLMALDTRNKSGNNKIVKFLLAKGAKPKSIYSEHRTLLNQILTDQELFEYLN